MEKRSMKHYAGLDVSVKETSVCIVDEVGDICREVKVASHPEDLVQVLKDPVWPLERIGLEAGPLSQWLFSGMVEAGLPAICIETRHTKAFLKAQVNKSDRNDARGIAQIMRVNLFRPVHVKTLASQKHRALLTARKLLQEKAHSIENDIRGLLRNFGLKVGAVGAVKFDERIRELVEDVPELADIMGPLLTSRKQLRGAFMTLHRKLLSIVRDHAVCRRLMTIPGVGPVVSLSHVDRWHGIPLDERGRAWRRLTVPAERPETLEFRRRRIDAPRGTMDGASSLWLLCRSHSARSGRESDCAAPFP